MRFMSPLASLLLISARRSKGSHQSRFLRLRRGRSYRLHLQTQYSKKLICFTLIKFSCLSAVCDSELFQAWVVAVRCKWLEHVGALMRHPTRHLQIPWHCIEIIQYRQVKMKVVYLSSELYKLFNLAHQTERLLNHKSHLSLLAYPAQSFLLVQGAMLPTCDHPVASLYA